MKFTFKTHKSSGPYRSFHTATTDIKLKKKVVGSISQKELGEPFNIRFQVIKDDINEDKNPNCKWKWITLQMSFSTLDKAKEFINDPDRFDAILKKYNLHMHDDD